METTYLNEEGKLNEEFSEFLDNFIKNDNINYKRAQKLRHYIDKRNFDDFIGRIIKEHDDAYFDKCYQKNCEPYPNNKFKLLLKLVEIEGEEVKEIDFKDTNFPNQVFKYKNYYFQWVFAQGVTINIYDERYELIFKI